MQDLNEYTRIIVNGMLLTPAESATFRVALGTFALDIDAGDLSALEESLKEGYRTTCMSLAQKLGNTKYNLQVEPDRCPRRSECNADRICIYHCATAGKEKALEAFNKAKGPKLLGCQHNIEKNNHTLVVHEDLRVGCRACGRVLISSEDRRRL